MRQLVIDNIRASQWYDDCIANGLETIMPILEKQADSELLEILLFALSH